MSPDLMPGTVTVITMVSSTMPALTASLPRAAVVGRNFQRRPVPSKVRLRSCSVIQSCFFIGVSS